MSTVETKAGSAPAGGGRGGAGTRIATGEAPEPREPRQLRATLARAFAWALGAALGVAAGAYLTAMSGAGAPGMAGIEPSTDLVALPALAFVAMFAVHLLAGGLLRVVKRHRRR